MRARWIYDTLAVGQLTSTTRIVDGAQYTTSVTGYTASYQPLGTSVSLPATVLGGAAAQSQTYTTTYGYTAGGALETTTLPAAGNLGAETVTTRYDANGMPAWMGSGFGWGAYVADARYTAFGETSCWTWATRSARSCPTSIRTPRTGWSGSRWTESGSTGPSSTCDTRTTRPGTVKSLVVV